MIKLLIILGSFETLLASESFLGGSCLPRRRFLQIKRPDGDACMCHSQCTGCCLDNDFGEKICWGLDKCPNGMLDDFKCKYGAFISLGFIFFTLGSCLFCGIKIEKKIRKLRKQRKMLDL